MKLKLVLKSGLVPPGTEFIVLKLAIKLVFVTAVIYSMIYDTQEFNTIVAQNTNAIIVEAQNNESLPVDTLTTILGNIEKMTPQGKVNYLLAHRDLLLEKLNQTSNLTKEQSDTLTEIINFLTRVVNDLKNEVDKQAFYDVIVECKKIQELKKK